MIWQKKKQFTVAETQKHGIRQYIFRTIVYEVSFFVVNPMNFMNLYFQHESFFYLTSIY